MFLFLPANWNSEEWGLTSSNRTLVLGLVRQCHLNDSHIRLSIQGCSQCWGAVKAACSESIYTLAAQVSYVDHLGGPHCSSDNHVFIEWTGYLRWGDLLEMAAWLLNCPSLSSDSWGGGSRNSENECGSPRNILGLLCLEVQLDSGWGLENLRLWVLELPDLPMCSAVQDACSLSIAFSQAGLCSYLPTIIHLPFHFSFCLFLVLFFVFSLSHLTLVHASRSVYSCIHLRLHLPGGTQVVDRKPAFPHTKETHCPFNPSASYIDTPRATH